MAKCQFTKDNVFNFVSNILLSIFRDGFQGIYSQNWHLNFNTIYYEGEGGFKNTWKFDYVIYGWSQTLDDYELLQNNEIEISG